MKKFIFIAILALLVPLSVLCQTVTPEQVANQRLGKAMDVIDKQDAQISAQQKQIDDLFGVINALKGENSALHTTNDVLLKQNQDLSKLKANTFSLFFGLVKFKRYK